MRLDVQVPARDIFFDRFRLDVESGRLWAGATELAIRPKTLAVLRYLAESPGRLVTTAELVHAVWADSHGSAPLVKGCVREVRKVLGDDFATPRYLETVGRRGYRFVAPVHDGSAPTASWAADAPAPKFVGRARELGLLDARLDAALSGTRQMVLVAGDPGIGKTTLVTQFLRGAAARHELGIARGQCIEHYGPGEPYLPVLQALGVMCRSAGADRVVAILGRYAPTWVAHMPALFSTAERERLRVSGRGTNREWMVRELCDAAVALAAERPLILWLDDLHWSDPSTVDLLAALALHTEPARVLVLATYRPADVVVSGHPLGSARKTLLTSGRAVEIGLAALSGAEVQRYLSLRFPANAIPPTLGAAILEITDGNPLFLTSLLDELVAERVLEKEGDLWKLRTRVEDLGEILPDSTRHLIERQVERLAEVDRRILEAGSVAGQVFSAGAVAAALGGERSALAGKASALIRDADAVDERLQALAAATHLIEARGLDSPPERATSGRYAFVHALHRRVLYGRLSPARRAHLHRRLGAAQDAAWGDRSDEIAGELALHFEEGGEAARAIRFRRVAAEHAAERLASTEAIAHLTRALGLVDRLARRERSLEELRLQMALGLMLMNSRGHAAADVDRAYRRAADLSARIETRPELYRTLRGLHRVTLIRGDVDRAMALARKGVAMARKGGQAEKLLEAHLALGVSLFYAGKLVPARAALRRCLRLRQAVSASSPVFRVLDPAIVIRTHLAFVAWLFGDEAELREHRDEMWHQARELGQPLSLAYAHIGAVMLHQFAGDADAVRADAEALLTAGTEQGFALLVALARCCRGWAGAVGAREKHGVDQIRAGLDAWRATGAEFLVPYQLGLLGDAQAALGQRAAALATVEEGLAIARRTGERWWEPELLRLAGELRGRIAGRTRGPARVRARRLAVASLRKAVGLARARGAEALAERSRRSLAALV